MTTLHFDLIKNTCSSSLSTTLITLQNSKLDPLNITDHIMLSLDKSSNKVPVDIYLYYYDGRMPYLESFNNIYDFLAFLMEYYFDIIVNNTTVVIKHIYE